LSVTENLQTISQTFLTPAQVAEVLQITPKAVIARFAEMAGVLVLPAVGAREKRERYRRIRVPKHVLDSFIASNTVQQSTVLSVARNRKKVRRSDARLGRAA